MNYVVVYDPKGHTTISKETHHMNMDYSAYEGTVIDGKVDSVEVLHRTKR